MDRQPSLRGNGFAVSRDLDPKLVRFDALKPLGRLTRKHPKQIQKLAESLAEFGFRPSPRHRRRKIAAVAGWGLVLAARKMGNTDAPAVVIGDLRRGETSGCCGWRSIAWAKSPAGTGTP